MQIVLTAYLSDMSASTEQISRDFFLKRGEKKVCFDDHPTYFKIASRTEAEIELCWWTQSETQATKRVCRFIAKESRKIWCISKRMDDIHRLVHSGFSSENASLDSKLLDTHVARRLVQSSSSTFASLRGLENQVCESRTRQLRTSRLRICHMQRLPGMNAEHLCQVSQKYSRFDRLMARLLGEADALYQAEQRNHDHEKPIDKPLKTVGDDNVALLQLIDLQNYRCA
jgi:hypothetical protein